jgi:hypothetical protein
MCVIMSTISFADSAFHLDIVNLAHHMFRLCLTLWRIRTGHRRLFLAALNTLLDAFQVTQQAFQCVRANGQRMAATISVEPGQGMREPCQRIRPLGQWRRCWSRDNWARFMVAWAFQDVAICSIVRHAVWCYHFGSFSSIVR